MSGGDDEPTLDGDEAEGNTQSAADLDTLREPRERAFTCVLCGFSTIVEAAPLQYEAQSVCANCGDWTTQLADQTEVLDTAKEIAVELDGLTLTERQALAYILREVVEMDRQPTADVMDSTPSNVDNLQRKAAEKLEDAEQVLEALDTIQVTDEEPTT